MSMHIKPRALAFFEELRCGLNHYVTQSDSASPHFLAYHPPSLSLLTAYSCCSTGGHAGWA